VSDDVFEDPPDEGLPADLDAEGLIRRALETVNAAKAMPLSA